MKDRLAMVAVLAAVATGCRLVFASAFVEVCLDARDVVWRGVVWCVVWLAVWYVVWLVALRNWICCFRDKGIK